MWDKRPRRADHEPAGYRVAMEHRGDENRWAKGEGATRGVNVAHDFGAAAGSQAFQIHQQQQQQQQSQHNQNIPTGTSFAESTRTSFDSVAAFDRLRFQTLGETETAAAAAGLLCGGLGIQAGVPQSQGGVVSETPGGWGKPFHAVPASRLG